MRFTNDIAAFPNYVKFEKLSNGYQRTLDRLDMLEGNGSLYDRVDVEVLGHPSHTYMAQTYVYKGKIKADKLVTIMDQPWGKKKDADIV